MTSLFRVVWSGAHDVLVARAAQRPPNTRPILAQPLPPDAPRRARERRDRAWRLCACQRWHYRAYQGACVTCRRSAHHEGA